MLVPQHVLKMMLKHSQWLLLRKLWITFKEIMDYWVKLLG